MFQRLLVCTDLSDGLQRLVHFVPSLAATGIQQVTFLHCVPLDEGGRIPKVNQAKVDQARQYLGQAQEHGSAAIKVAIAVESGRPADVILKAVRDYQADLLMVGYPLRSAFSEQVFGSTAVELYSKASIPILSMRPQLISTYTTEELDLRLRHLFRHCMVPYDGSPTAQIAVQKIKQFAIQQQEAGQTVLEACNFCWVLDDVERREIPQEPFVAEARQKLAAVEQELETVHLTVATEVRKGSAIAEVLAACLLPDISLIVVCHGNRSRWLQLSVPSFTHELLHCSWHPVLYLPSKVA